MSGLATTHEVLEHLASASAHDLLVNGCYAIAFIAVFAEVGWLARRPGRERRTVIRSAATATGMAAGAAIVAVGYTSVLAQLWSILETVRWDAAASFWRTHPLLAVPAAFVAWDLVGWLYHLVGHRTRTGWAAHQVHHTGASYDLTLGLRQSWFPLHGLLLHPLLALAGFDLAVVAACAAVSNCWQVLEHTSLRLPFPSWFAAIVMTPDAHRHHHGQAGAATNLGPVLTIWDRLAGTWVPADRPAPAVYGSVANPSGNPLTIELAGWRALVRSRRHRPADVELAGSASLG
jgi:sterol desaturase/sphingolipid hydroxylase (fatty acid hydroxylase superfamily)